MFFDSVRRIFYLVVREDRLAETAIHILADFVLRLERVQILDDGLHLMRWERRGWRVGQRVKRVRSENSAGNVGEIGHCLRECVCAAIIQCEIGKVGRTQTHTCPAGMLPIFLVSAAFSDV
jgi:hypothetical protein